MNQMRQLEKRTPPEEAGGALKKGSSQNQQKAEFQPAVDLQTTPDIGELQVLPSRFRYVVGVIVANPPPG